MEYDKTCPMCGQPFTTTRADAICCSSRCRMRKKRDMERMTDEQAMLLQLRNTLPAPRKPKPATPDNIAETLTAIKGETSALRFYARSCPAPLRPRCTVLADCIDQAMREVGF